MSALRPRSSSLALSRLLPLVVPVLLLGGCGGKRADSSALRAGDSREARARGVLEVRQRPVFEAPSSDAAWLLEQVPEGDWDEGLADAAAALLNLHVERGARIDAASAAGVSARAGYPGQARFQRVLNGGGLPVQAARELAEATDGEPVDLGLAVRRYSDGTALWILAWSRRVARLDPVPARISLDDPLPIRVELSDTAMSGADLRLFLAPPSGPVEELSITPGVVRWVDAFHVPGEWRIEVIARTDERVEVAQLFSVWVDAAPAALPPLSEPAAAVEPPHEAERALFGALNRLRAEHGLPAVRWFSTYEPLVREHAAFMASAGRAAHVIDGLTPGVAARAKGFAHPLAFHHQAVAVAPTTSEAMDLVVDSPAHRRTLLCQPCTHATVGVALEPVLDRPPRLFVTWELMEFPKGPPRPLSEQGR